MPLFDDAPMIEFQDTVDVTDVYQFASWDLPDDAPAGSGDTWDDDFPDEGDTTGTEPLSFDAEDTFAFVSFGPQDGSATGDNATPAPPEEPDVNPYQDLIDRETNLNRARHSATLAYLQRALVYGD